MYIDSLWTIAELTLVVVGFSGIVAALGKRGSGNWSGEDISRMSVMVIAASRTLLASVLPIVFIHFGVFNEVLWPWASGIFGVLSLISLVVLLRISKRVKRDSRHSSLLQYTVITLSFVAISVNLLNAIGVVFHGTFGAYFLTLVLGFLVTWTYFVRLIQTGLLPKQLSSLERG